MDNLAASEWATRALPESNYLQAKDAERVFARAGAVFIGPYATEEVAMAGIHSESPHAAVLDACLLTGTNFAFASELATLQIPFFTGLNALEFSLFLCHLLVLSKPVDFGLLHWQRVGRGVLEQFGERGKFQAILGPTLRQVRKRAKNRGPLIHDWTVYRPSRRFLPIVFRIGEVHRKKPRTRNAPHFHCDIWFV